MPTSMEILKAKMLEKKAASAQTSMVPSIPINTTTNIEVVSSGETQATVPGITQFSSQAAQVLERLQYLKESMEKQLPGFEGMLHTIHKQLQSDPELTHILKPDQIGIVIQAMLKHKNIVITQESASKVKRKPLKDTSVEDL